MSVKRTVVGADIYEKAEEMLQSFNIPIEKLDVTVTSVTEVNMYLPPTKKITQKFTI
jgi:hypothetical protein